MNRTVHKKLTEKHLATAAPALLAYPADEAHGFTLGLTHEVNMLKEAAKELLQPRPQAIAQLLKLAKDL